MFEEKIRSFSENLDNLRNFVEVVSEFLREKSSQEIKENARGLAQLLYAFHKLNPDAFDLDDDVIARFDEDFGSKIVVADSAEDEKSKKVQSLNFDALDESEKDDLEEATKVFHADTQRMNALYNNALISLMSSVEWFLAQLIHKHYEDNPGMVGGKEKQFSLEDLANFDTVDDARNFLIERSTESVLRGSIEDWLDFLSSKLKLSMGYLKDYKEHLVEASQRRNLLVHNNGVVNRIYQLNYPKALGEPPSIGKELSVSPEYLSETISKFERSFLLIAAELWKKVGKDDEARGKLLINLGYDHLLTKRYDIAESLSLFAANDKSLQEIDGLYAKINYWIAKKFSGSFDEVKEEIEREDFSAKSRLFVLAKNVLLDYFEEASKDIEYLIEHDDDFGFSEVQTWPLFEGFREQQQYQDLLMKYSPNPVEEE